MAQIRPVVACTGSAGGSPPCVVNWDVRAHRAGTGEDAGRVQGVLARAQPRRHPGDLDLGLNDQAGIRAALPS